MDHETKTCHCGKPAVEKCPCCDQLVCAKHLAIAARALAEAVGLPKLRVDSEAGLDPAYAATMGAECSEDDTIVLDSVTEAVKPAKKIEGYWCSERRDGPQFEASGWTCTAPMIEDGPGFAKCSDPTCGRRVEYTPEPEGESEENYSECGRLEEDQGNPTDVPFGLCRKCGVFVSGRQRCKWDGGVCLP